MSDACPWWIAWWHRRLRRMDHRVIWPSLRALADAREPTDSEAAVLLALRGWALFIQQDGQAHWRCPCAALDPPESAPPQVRGD
jgi:hypothetical protein